MKIELAFSFNNLNAADLHNKVVVIIDILRATTSMITALANGALSVISVSEIEKAVSLKKHDPNSLLCGERNGIKIDGFDKGNSPKEFVKGVEGKNLIFSSTNGSKTIDQAKESKKLYLGSFNNANELARFLIENHIDDEIIFACSGKAGKACIEDTLCAGYMIDLISKDLITLPLDDGSIMARNFYQTNKEEIHHLIINSEHGHLLESLGFSEDIKDSCDLDKTGIIPYYDKSKSKIII